MTHANLIAEAAERLGQPRVSFEFFPPKTEALETQLWESIRKLEPLHPSFVSVTYGAGGSTRSRTHKTVARIVKETALQPAAHLTCVAADRDEIEQVLDAYWGAGVRHLMALRGDAPGGAGAVFEPHPQGFKNAAELVAAAKRQHDFEISVAVHPEKHPDSPSWDAEIDNFKRKLDVGATRGVSQFFFEADTFLNFRDRLARAGVNVPIVPGIMPVTNFKGLMKMAQGCQATVPHWLATLFDGLDNDPETRRLVAAATTAELCARLSAEGVEDFHFYTLNRADLTLAICRIVGVRVAKEAA
ncbi:MAG: methylenetetrahydrofolate reductase [NAD(P)H] [Proteobacteria bacterium]|nr:methylenetetrahydrofolate reductase [NAD(P)H] [Pseudomonadota bacterium]